MTLTGFLTIDGVRKAVTLEIPALNPQEGESVIALPHADLLGHINELTLRQHPNFDDPVGLRFAGRGIGKGKISGNDLRADGVTQEETSLLQFKRNEVERDHPEIHSGEVTLHCRDGRATAPGDDGMRFVQQWRHSETQIVKAVINHLVVNRVTLRGTEV